MKVYETERLILKTLGPKDYRLVLDYYFRNKDFIEQFEGIKDEEFFTSKRQKQLRKIDLKLQKQGKYNRLWIFKKEDKNKIIGTIGFTEIIRGIFQSCFLGYKLDKDELNKGYMTEAIKKGIEIMFSEYQLHRIEANVMPRNLPSIRVLEKCGFENEGLSKKYLKINGIWEDHIHMVLLNERLEG